LFSVERIDNHRANVSMSALWLSPSFWKSPKSSRSQAVLLKLPKHRTTAVQQGPPSIASSGSWDLTFMLSWMAVVSTSPLPLTPKFLCALVSLVSSTPSQQFSERENYQKFVQM
jgi:hypothetical protein